MSICEAFEAAKGKVKDKFGLAEEKKLKLLKNCEPGKCIETDERLKKSQ